MTPDEIEEKVYSSAKKNNIIFEDGIVLSIVSSMSQNIFLQKDKLNLLTVVLFSEIRKGHHGGYLNDDRNGKLITRKTVDGKNITLYFIECKKLFKYYFIYHYEISTTMRPIIKNKVIGYQ